MRPARLLRVLPRHALLPTRSALPAPPASLLAQQIRTKKSSAAKNGRKGSATSPKDTKGDADFGDTTVVIPTKGKSKSMSRDWDEASVERTGAKEEVEGSFELEFDHIRKKMDNAVERLRKELGGMQGRVGRITPALLDPVKVDLEGERHPLHAIASISVREGTTLFVSVFDEDMLKHAEKAIFSANLGLTPQRIDSKTIKMPVPRPTAEARNGLVHQATEAAEKTRVAIRGLRQTALKHIKKEEAGKASADIKGAEKLIQQATDKTGKEVDEALEKAKKAILQG